MRKTLLYFLLSATIASCASHNLQSSKIIDDYNHSKLDNLPAVSEVKNVPFVSQSAGQCGPATLSMVLQKWQPHNKKFGIDEILPLVMSNSSQASGSLQSDLISGARRLGMTAVVIRDFRSLLYEIAADHPVIIFENLGLSWYTQWHYAVAIGYDFIDKKIKLHSGPNAHQLEDISIFEKSWRLGDYWGLVVLPATETAVSVSEVEHLKSAASLEATNDYQNAELAYKAILKRWPQSTGALFGLGNLALHQKKFTTAISHYEMALKYNPDSYPILFNLSQAQRAIGQIKFAEENEKKAFERQKLQLKNTKDTELNHD